MFGIKRERVRAVREEITATQFLVPTSAAWQNGTHLEQSRAIGLHQRCVPPHTWPQEEKHCRVLHVMMPFK